MKKFERRENSQYQIQWYLDVKRCSYLPIFTVFSLFLFHKTMKIILS